MSTEYTPTFLLRGVAGSTAHGLAREGSDEDLHGVFSWPTEAFWSLDKPAESLTGHEPQDYAYHEVEKFIRLALSNNPNLLELLWLDEYTDVETVWGEMLLNHRSQFLYTEGVKSAFLGYAESQFRKIGNRADGTFSSDTRNRTSKHARHLFRLLEQAESLLTTGSLSVRVRDPQWYFDLETKSLSEWTDLYMQRSGDLKEIKSVLPDAPDRQYWDDFLYSYREAH